MKTNTEFSKRIASGALALSVTATAAAGMAYADGDIVHIVKEGEWLGKIAEYYFGKGNDYLWHDIAVYNNIDGSLIYPGQKIIIPGSLIASLNYNVEEDNTIYPEDEAYVAKSGDILWCIATNRYRQDNENAEHKLSEQALVDKLSTYNQKSDPNAVEVGEVIYLPCFEKLSKVVEWDYTDEYNRMGWRLNHPEGCHPCGPIDPYQMQIICTPGCPPIFINPCFEHPEPQCGPRRILKP